MSDATEIARREPGRGRDATAPSRITFAGWKDILWRVWREFNQDRVMLVAAGVTFYLLLAIFPALTVFVSIFGYFADPTEIAGYLSWLDGVIPAGGIDLIGTQLETLAAQNDTALSFGVIIGFLVALWSANNGIKALFEAMNVAFQEQEKRSFIWLNLTTLLFTLGTFFVAIVFIVGVGIIPAILALVGAGGFTEVIVSLARWPILFVIASLAISLLYRYGPSREPAKWRWVSWGSVLATAIWLLSALLFSWYLTNFANYNATYGSLGAVIAFLTWIWVSMVVLIMGAEVNAEMEHQTARDSTTGPEQPMGQRGAAMADTVGKSLKSAS